VAVAVASGAFPEGFVLSIDQRQNGVLLACADDEYQWTGGIDLQSTPGQGAEKAAEAVASAFGDRDGFTTEIREGATGPTAVVSGPGGLSFVGGLEGDDLVTVVSSSTSSSPWCRPRRPPGRLRRPGGVRLRDRRADR
jgi:hypothetical protein